LSSPENTITPTMTGRGPSETLLNLYGLHSSNTLQKVTSLIYCSHSAPRNPHGTTVISRTWRRFCKDKFSQFVNENRPAEFLFRRDNRATSHPQQATQVQRRSRCI